MQIEIKTVGKGESKRDRESRVTGEEIKNENKKQ